LNTDEKRIIKLTTASHSLVHLFEGVLPPLIPLVMAEFGTDYFHLGLIVTAFSYAFGIGSLPSGFLSDKVGPRRLISLYLFGAGGMAVLVLPTGSLLSYGIIMALIGLFCSTYHPASNTLISLGIQEKGKAFGLHGIAGSLGVAAVPVLSAWIGTGLGWRMPHLFFGLIGIGIGIYSLSIPSPVASTATQGRGVALENRGNSISYFNLIIFFLSAMSLGLTYKGIMTFLPSYMGEKVRIGFFTDPVALGGMVATVALLSGALGQYMAGRGVDRHRAEKLYFGSILMGTVFVFLMAVSNNAILVGAAILYAFFYFSTQPIQNCILSTYLPKHRHGLGYGIHFFVTFGIGSTSAAVCGYLADQFGLNAVFYAMGICFIAAGLLSSVLWFRVSGKEITSSG
jgi:MFS family permease